MARERGRILLKTKVTRWLENRMAVEDAKDTRTLRREEQSAQERIKKEEREEKTGDDKRMKGRKRQKIISSVRCEEAGSACEGERRIRRSLLEESRNRRLL